MRPSHLLPGLPAGHWPGRRDLLAGAAVVILLGLLAAGSLHRARLGAPAPETAADPALALTWQDLRPEAERRVAIPSGPIDHPRLVAARLSGRLPGAGGSARTMAAFDGRTVRLTGWAMPLGDGGSAGQFLLVPYFGACAHVPPPPVNQTILVRTGQPAELTMFAPVEVVGVLRQAARRTHHARAGYVIAAQSAVPHRTDD